MSRPGIGITCRLKYFLVAPMETGARPRNVGNHAFTKIGALETEQRMTFETEMDQFFARNCYSEKERLRVKAWPAYGLAAEKKDIIEAQEIATRVLEQGLGIPGAELPAGR